MVVREPLARVEQIVGQLRRVADEIVVAVDSRVLEEHLCVLRGSVDRLVRVEVVLPIERTFAWLYQQCAGEWILRVDDDECLSEALLSRLGHIDEIPASVTHVVIPTRWTWPDATTYLESSPWNQDAHPRLMRHHDARRLAPRALHDQGRLTGDRLRWREPLYHLDLIVNDVDTRSRKAAVYEDARPGLRSFDGRALSVAFYLPERRADLALAPLEPCDVDAISSLVAASRATDTARHLSDVPTSPVVLVDRLTVEQPTSTTPAGASRARLTTYVSHSEIAEHEDLVVIVGVTNSGEVAWRRRDDDLGVLLGAHWLHPDGSLWRNDVARAKLPCDLAPGESAEVEMIVPSPGGPGEYLLHVGVLEENVAWFEEPIRQPVRVRPQSRVFIFPSTSPFRHLGDDIILRGTIAALALRAPDLGVKVIQDWPPGRRDDVGFATVPGPAGPLFSRGLSRRLVLSSMRELWRDARDVSRGEEAQNSRSAPFLDALSTADCLVVLGAGALTSTYRDELWMRVAAVGAARCMGLPVIVAGSGWGPIRGLLDRFVARRMLRDATAVHLRDGVERATATPLLGRHRRRIIPGEDLARYSRRADPDEGRECLLQRGVDGEYAVLSLRGGVDDEHTLSALESVVRHLQHRGLTCVFVPHVEGSGPYDDAPVGHELARRCPGVVVLSPMPSDALCFAVHAGAVVSVGTRYHAAVLATSAGVPAVQIVRSSTRYDRQRGEGLSAVTPGPLAIHPLDRDVTEIVTVIDRLLDGPLERATTPSPEHHPVLGLLNDYTSLLDPSG